MAALESRAAQSGWRRGNPCQNRHVKLQKDGESFRERPTQSGPIWGNRQERQPGGTSRQEEETGQDLTIPGRRGNRDVYGPTSPWARSTDPRVWLAHDEYGPQAAKGVHDLLAGCGTLICGRSRAALATLVANPMGFPPNSKRAMEGSPMEEKHKTRRQRQRESKCRGHRDGGNPTQMASKATTPKGEHEATASKSEGAGLEGGCRWW